ncbi:hypothetical protein OS493_007706 [Desmophyllum pertusum]|uniref:G-protein coupled receptors family 1 profile domain-containing protein n=1 Tax=Desmophyllum pertusum TaxID=174260 RepID=A0A9W9YUR1_9CNID|nr:hypothetical protein OS493_007706 [Desmophyllum pertusum]
MAENVSANFTSALDDISELEQPTLSTRIVTGIILAVICIIGGLGNSRVIIIFVKTPTLFSKTTRLILTALATVDFTGCLVNIPLAFGVLVLRPGRDELFYLSLAHVIATYCVLWCSYFCFVLIGCDMNDTVRKMTRRGNLLTVHRIRIALVVMILSALGVGIFVYSLRVEDPFVLQTDTHRSGAKHRFGVFLRIAVFAAGVLSFLSLVHSFLRVRTVLKRHNRIMSELHGLNRKSDQMKQKKMMRTVIEMFVCFVVVYMPLFVVNILQDQGKLDSVDPIAIARAVFFMTYASNFLVYGRNLRFFFRSFLSACPCF